MNTQTGEKSQPCVSVVIPVFNGGDDLDRCLAAIRSSTYPILEILLVDDASTDGMADTAARRHAARVIRLQHQQGPAKARNLGVTQARGDIVVFTDADVLLHPEAIGLAVEALQSDPGLGAVFGSYDAQPEHGSFISQYRNLLHHWVHQGAAEQASTFWTGCGAIRRAVFMEMGGFNQAYRKPSIEDIELGSRLRRAGYKIRLLKNMHGKHMKQWTLWNTMRTDIFHRAVPWMLLLLRDGDLTNDLNINYKSRLATVAAALLGLSVPLLIILGHPLALLPLLMFLLVGVGCAGIYQTSQRNGPLQILMPALAVTAPLLGYWLLPDVLALPPLLLLLLIIISQLGFYRFVWKRRSPVFAVGVVPMQLIFFLGCAIAIPLALAESRFGGRKAPSANEITPTPE